MNVAIIGRPNVGKSSVFNRLVGRRRSLVHNAPGITRDRVEAFRTIVRGDKEIKVKFIDTGGIGGEFLDAEIQEQVNTALKDCDLALFVVDGTQGVHPLDEKIHQGLRRSGVFEKTHVIGLVNKIDNAAAEELIPEFYALDFPELIDVSAEHNLGFDEVIQRLFDLHENVEDHLPEDQQAGARITIIGKPNVGKSTLTNALTGQTRMIASPTPGTTTDSVETSLKIDEVDYSLVDTAGIPRKDRTKKGVETLSIVQTIKSLQNSDLAILVLDGEKGVDDQDEKIAGQIEKAGCSLILLVNKWDIQRGNLDFPKKEAAERIRKQFRFLNFAPILFASALKGKGIEQLHELISEVLSQRRNTLSTSEFTRFVRRETTMNNPFGAKFYFCHQISKHPPSFACHVNSPKKIHFSLQRHLVNRMREEWGYMGTPIRIKFIQRQSKFD